MQLSQCRLKISQRLRERAPFIKLEQMKVSRGITKAAIRPMTSLSGAVGHRRPVSAPVPLPPRPVEIITVTDASSDEESVGFDDSSLSGNDNISLRSALESILVECDQDLEEPSCGDKRFAEYVFELDFPQHKRPRKVSVDEQDDYANMLLKEASLLDDISVASCDDLQDGTNDFQFESFDAALPGDFNSGEDDMLEYLQVLF